MKTFFLFILLIFNSLLVFSQFFGGTKHDQITAQTVVDESTIYLTGFTKNFTKKGSDDVFVMRINLSKSTIDYKTFGDEYNDRAYDINVIDNNIFISGESHKGFGQNYGRENAFLLKIDNKLKIKQQFSPYFYHRDAILKTKELFDGNLISVGYSRSFNTGNNSIGDIFVLKSTKDFDTLWHKAYNSAGNDYCFDFIEKDDDNLVLLGTSGGFFNLNQADYRYSHDADIIFIETDDTGNELNRVYWGETGHDFAKQIIESPEKDGFYIVGSTQSYGNGNFDILLLKVDYNFNEIWHKTFGGSSTDYGKSIAFSEYDNSLYILGTKSNEITNLPELALISTNLDGELIDDKNFNLGKYTLGVGLDILPDGYCIISGNTGKSFDNFDFFSFKFSFADNEAVFLLSDLILNCYPNPVSKGQDITFEIRNDKKYSNLYFQIYSISGNTILRQEFNNSKISVNTSSFSKGLYIYSVIMYNRAAYVGKFIVD
ncbi:MAG: T9SS type A sorting domain-containing protein [Bacteroidota bacterium]|nr:T9SS type A sorting domain-containing protein [Bacteroidota bacterium]